MPACNGGKADILNLKMTKMDRRDMNTLELAIYLFLLSVSICFYYLFLYHYAYLSIFNFI